MSSINIHELLTSLAAASEDQKAFRESVLEWTGSPDSKKKSRKSKKSSDGEDKPKVKRAPTAWNAWIESCCGKKGSETAEYLAWKEEQKEAGAKPSMMAYAKSRKEEDTEAYDKFAANFKSSASSAASATTHDSEDEAAEPVAELEAKPAKKAAAKGKKAAAASDTSDAEVAVVIEAKPAKKAAAKPKKAAKKVVEDSDSE
jgi:hypothetical protein